MPYIVDGDRVYYEKSVGRDQYACGLLVGTTEDDVWYGDDPIDIAEAVRQSSLDPLYSTSPSLVGDAAAGYFVKFLHDSIPVVSLPVVHGAEPPLVSWPVIATDLSRIPGRFSVKAYRRLSAAGAFTELHPALRARMSRYRIEIDDLIGWRDSASHVFNTLRQQWGLTQSQAKRAGLRRSAMLASHVEITGPDGREARVWRYW